MLSNKLVHMVKKFLKIAKFHTPKCLDSPIVVSAESKIILTLQGIIKGFKVRFGAGIEKAQPMIKDAENAIKRSPAYSGYFSEKFPVVSKHLRCTQLLK